MTIFCDEKYRLACNLHNTHGVGHMHMRYPHLFLKEDLLTKTTLNSYYSHILQSALTPNELIAKDAAGDILRSCQDPGCRLTASSAVGLLSGAAPNSTCPH